MWHLPPREKGVYDMIENSVKSTEEPNEDKSQSCTISVKQDRYFLASWNVEGGVFRKKSFHGWDFLSQNGLCSEIVEHSLR